jgi:hypothetical protein
MWLFNSFDRNRPRDDIIPPLWVREHQDSLSRQLKNELSCNGARDSLIYGFIYPSRNGEACEYPSLDPNSLLAQCLIMELFHSSRSSIYNVPLVSQYVWEDIGEPDMSPNGALPLFVDQTRHMTFTWDEYKPILIALWNLYREKYVIPASAPDRSTQTEFLGFLETECFGAIMFCCWDVDISESIYVDTIPKFWLLQAYVYWRRRRVARQRYFSDIDRGRAKEVLLGMLEKTEHLMCTSRPSNDSGPFIFGSILSLADIVIFSYIMPIYILNTPILSREEIKSRPYLFRLLKSLHDRWFKNSSAL